MAAATPEPAVKSVAVATAEPSVKPVAAVHRRPNAVLDDGQIASIKRRLHLSPHQERMWPAVEAGAAQARGGSTRPAAGEAWHEGAAKA